MKSGITGIEIKLAMMNRSIGESVQRKRIENGMSRSKLAQTICVSHQQLEKYEKGKNRISAGLMFLIAERLNTPLEYFYNFNTQDNMMLKDDESYRMKLSLFRWFSEIHNIQLKRLVLQVAKVLAEEVKV